MMYHKERTECACHLDSVQGRTQPMLVLSSLRNFHKGFHTQEIEGKAISLEQNVPILPVCEL